MRVVSFVQILWNCFKFSAVMPEFDLHTVELSSCTQTACIQASVMYLIVMYLILKSESESEVLTLKYTGKKLKVVLDHPDFHSSPLLCI